MTALGNPLAGNPLRTREDVQAAVRALFEPLAPAYRAGGARVALGGAGAQFPLVAQDLEGFARPLWGVVPLVAGGGRFDHWELIVRGLTGGTDPDSASFWGEVTDHDQRMVEMAAIGFALAVVPECVWDPLPAPARTHLVRWLTGINEHEPFPNNWQFFRVIVNLGLRRVEAPIDAGKLEASLQMLESHYVADGWYRDGDVPGNFDHYIGWAYHYYGLLYAVLAEADPERGQRFRDRARLFAPQFAHWFDPSGRVVPYGRSLTYRFAAASFWAAVAYAGEEVLPWGVVKGLYLRHLRQWAQWPIAGADGILRIGYTYENQTLAESYNSPGSPYWAMKAFLALACPADHPFWRAEEEPVQTRHAVSVQSAPGVILSSDETQTLLLNGGRGMWFVRGATAKYGKLAYSSLFGWSLDPDDPLFGAATDSALVLCDSDGRRAARDHAEATRVEGELIYTRWRPWRDVCVETVLWGAAPWHLRVHRIRSERRLTALEGGFALGWHGGDPWEAPPDLDERPGVAGVRNVRGLSEIRDLDGSRAGRVVRMQPNTNLIHPRTLLPVLEAEVDAGETILSCAVFATDRPDAYDRKATPTLPESAWSLLAQ